MSAQFIQLALPDPFYQTPSTVTAPISGITHIPAAQVLTLSGGGTVSVNVTAAQLLSPLVLNDIAGAIGEIFLPDAFTLSNALGNNDAINAVGILIPGFTPLPSTQIQVGDVFTIPVYQLSTSNSPGGTFFFPSTGGSGVHYFNNYATSGNHEALTIQFTAVGPSLATCSYTLQ